MRLQIAWEFFGKGGDAGGGGGRKGERTWAARQAMCDMCDVVKRPVFKSIGILLKQIRNSHFVPNNRSN